MKKIILLFFPLLTHSQKKCEGIVIDKTSGNRIPYATVGLIQENKGVSANEQGAFSIYSSFSKTDSLRITSIGYQTQMLAVLGWVSGKPVELLRTTGLLKEVVVSNKRKKVYTLNRFGHCSWNTYQIGSETVYQLAQRFEAPEEGLELTEVEMCKDRAESIFRLRFYDVDSISGGPSTDLIDTVLEVRSNAKHIQVNLEQYHITIPRKNFFVAIEWLFVPVNEVIEEVNAGGKKGSRTFYKPFIRWVNDKNLKKASVWELNFHGGWKKIYEGWQDSNFQITAHMK